MVPALWREEDGLSEVEKPDALAARINEEHRRVEAAAIVSRSTQEEGSPWFRRPR
jgi:hypothetical protein